MALKEPGAQLARPISVRVAADDSQFSQPIIWALIYAQRGHSPPLTNQRPECPRLVTVANQSGAPKQSQQQSGGEKCEIWGVVMSAMLSHKHRWKNNIPTLQKQIIADSTWWVVQIYKWLQYKVAPLQSRCRPLKSLHLFPGSRVPVGATVHHLSVVRIPDISTCLGPVMILQSCWEQKTSSFPPTNPKLLC